MISKIENLKDLYFKNQVVHLKLKTIIAKGVGVTISLQDDYNSSQYRVFTQSDDNISFNSDLYFILGDQFPSIKLFLIDKNGTILDSLNLDVNSNIQELHPPINFSNVIAKNFVIDFIDSSVYDESNNIVSLRIEANQSNLFNFSLNQNIENISSKEGDFLYSEISYYTILPKDIKFLSFSYFDLSKNSFVNKKIEINPKIEKISTQTDIKPTDNSNLFIINILIGVLIFIWLLLFLFRRKWIYLVLIIISVSILIFLNISTKEVVLKNGAKVHILPTDQSTIFFDISIDTPVVSFGKANGYDKIIINNRVGWVKESDVKKD